MKTRVSVEFNIQAEDFMREFWYCGVLREL